MTMYNYCGTQYSSEQF